MTTVDDNWQHVVVPVENVPAIWKGSRKAFNNNKVALLEGFMEQEMGTLVIKIVFIYRASFELTDQLKLHPDTKRQTKEFSSKR